MNTVVYRDGNTVCDTCDTYGPGQKVTYTTTHERVVNSGGNTIGTNHYVTPKDTGGTVTYEGTDSKLTAINCTIHVTKIHQSPTA